MAECFNSESYPDPTAYDALKLIELEEKRRKKIANGEWFMKWVYVASPYRGNTAENIKNARRYAAFVAKKTLVPVVPHLYLTQFLSDDICEERDAGLALGLQMLKRCHELWVFGGVVTEGMKAEIDFSKRHNIPIRYFGTDCKEVKGSGD